MGWGDSKAVLGASRCCRRHGGGDHHRLPSDEGNSSLDSPPTAGPAVAKRCRHLPPLPAMRDPRQDSLPRDSDDAKSDTLLPQGPELTVEGLRRPEELSRGSFLIGIDPKLAICLLRLMTLPLPREERTDAAKGMREMMSDQGDPAGAHIFFYFIAMGWLGIAVLGTMSVIALAALVDRVIGRVPPGGAELITFFAVSGILGAAGAGIGLARYRTREGRGSQLAAVDVALGGGWNAVQLLIAAIAAVLT